MTTVDEMLADINAKRLTCQHENFRVDAKVFRLTNEEKGKVTGYSADIKVCCADCGHPFTWVGVPHGYSPSEPRLSADSQELRAPIAPSNFDLERVLQKGN